MNIAAGGLQKNVWREGEISMTTWTQMREELTINELEELLIEREKTIIKDMEEARSASDALEAVVDEQYWPFPVYADLLFSE